MKNIDVNNVTSMEEGVLRPDTAKGGVLTGQVRTQLRAM